MRSGDVRPLAGQTVVLIANPAEALRDVMEHCHEYEARFLEGLRRLPIPPRAWQYRDGFTLRPVSLRMAALIADDKASVAAWLTDRGASEARVQVGMRHANASMTRRYSKQRDKGENARLMADILLGAA